MLRGSCVLVRIAQHVLQRSQDVRSERSAVVTPIAEGIVHQQEEPFRLPHGDRSLAPHSLDHCNCLALRVGREQLYAVEKAVGDRNGELAAHGEVRDLLAPTEQRREGCQNGALFRARAARQQPQNEEEAPARLEQQGVHKVAFIFI